MSESCPSRIEQNGYIGRIRGTCSGCPRHGGSWAHREQCGSGTTCYCGSPGYGFGCCSYFVAHCNLYIYFWCTHYNQGNYGDWACS